MHEEVGHGDQYLGDQRQLGMQAPVDLGKCRNHEDVERHQRGRGRAQHEHRIAQRGTHLLAVLALEAELRMQAHEHFVHPAGHLADPDHADHVT